jgi:hypothetical protein
VTAPTIHPIGSAGNPSGRAGTFADGRDAACAAAVERVSFGHVQDGIHEGGLDDGPTLSEGT